jgi:hypothetical protein
VKLRNFAPRDLIDLDVQKEWVDPKAHIIWEVDHPDHIRWMDQHSLEKADDQCAKVGLPWGCWATCHSIMDIMEWRVLLVITGWSYTSVEDGAGTYNIT